MNTPPRTVQMVHEEIHACYWRDDVNCAVTMLRVLGRVHGVSIHPQVLAAAVGMHGAGRYGAQCGLVEGSLMFLGLWGDVLGESGAWVADSCQRFARDFEHNFGSLACRVLRPQGFAPDQPPHMCEGLTVRVACWAVDWTRDLSPAQRV